jgi:hypothetical protein
LRLCSLYLQGCCKRLSASMVDLFTKWLMDIYIVLNRNNLFRDKAVSSLLRERKDNIIGLLVFFFFFFNDRVHRNLDKFFSIYIRKVLTILLHTCAASQQIILLNQDNWEWYGWER